jgi:glucosyl-dolichyl phosphate glucuronosyltransferase
VIICTRNRAELLEKALGSMVEQDFPPSDYEILIVDNGSTDGTPKVVVKCQGNVNIRYIREDRVGLCVARNTGWRAAEGKYVAFFDDDALARPGWLRAIRQAFEGSGSSIGIIGGRVDPIWQGRRPTWLSDAIANSLTIVDWGPFDKFIPDIRSEWLVGANMAVPKAILDDIGGFHPWLDRVGNNLLSSGDVFLQKKIMQRGYRCAYVPAMAIEHVVPPSRVTQKWFLQRYFWQGVSDAVMILIESVPSPAERLRLALVRSMGMLRSWRKVRSLLFRTEHPDIFTTKCFALIDIGYILGLLGAAKH